MRVLMLDAGLPSGSAFGDLLAQALGQRSIQLDRVSKPLQLESELHHAQTHGVLLVDAAAGDGADLQTDLAQELHAQRPSLAVIVLALARPDTGRHAAWFDADVDDCLPWPIDPVEAAARVAAAIRRIGRVHHARKLRHGDLVLDLSNASAAWRGDVVALTPREVVVLEVLMKHAGRVVSREALHNALHGDGDVRGNTVEVYVHGLRRKLRPGLIRTVRGSGYRLVDVAPTDP